MQDIYYNYVRPHQALEGKTPAEKAGIGIDEQNKWLGLIKKSLEKRQESLATHDFKNHVCSFFKL